TVAANGHTSVEAEDGFRTSKDYHNWCKRDKIAGYSGNGYYVVEPDSGTRVHIRPMEMSPGIEIPLKFEHAGKYRLWLRMSGPDTSGNSVYVGLDRQEVQSGKRMTVKPGGWRWLGDYEQGSPVMIEITEPGDHTLHLWMREDGVAIDRILLTTDPDFVPRNP
ncbi:MAG: hypothetical protein JXM70_11275, partial [Pirellulales bacterium]|nr:hypothetical protein [Pirellulales bacterium]